jgi:hypothetical protein
MSIRAFASSLLVTVVLVGGCSGGGPGALPGSPNGDGTAQVVLALTTVPTDVQCIRVIVMGDETLTRTFDVVPGNAATLMLGGLPLGEATLTETTYDALCANLTPDTEATWVSQMPVTLNLASNVTAMANIILRRPAKATLTNDFQDGALALTLNPSSVNFPGTLVGATAAPQVINVTNTGSVASGPIAAALSGSTDFSIASQTCSSGLAATASCSVTLAFKPTGTAGARAGQLVVSAGALSVTAGLTGMAISVPLTINPPGFDFGTVNLGSISPAQTFTVKNGGATSSGPLTVGISAGGVADFPITSGSGSCAGMNLAAGASCTILVSFNPLMVGTRTFQLNVTGNTAVSATLTGVGAQMVIWMNQDIGTATGGSINQTGGSLDVTGAGGDVYGKADAFQFASQSVTGDATITAKLTTVQNVNTWTKAMLMMRDGTSAGARYANVLGTPTPANSYRFQARLLANDVTASTPGGAGTLPVWLRLVRRGNTFTGSFSANGTAWTAISNATITNMPASLLVGVGVTSHLAGTLATAHFDFITITQP